MDVADERREIPLPEPGRPSAKGRYQGRRKTQRLLQQTLHRQT